MNMQELIAEHIGHRSVADLHEEVLRALPEGQVLRYETVRQWCSVKGRQPGKPAEAIALARALGIGELDVFEVLGWKPSGPDIRQRVATIEVALKLRGVLTEDGRVVPMLSEDQMSAVLGLDGVPDALDDDARPAAGG